MNRHESKFPSYVWQNEDGSRTELQHIGPNQWKSRNNAWSPTPWDSLPTCTTAVIASWIRLYVHDRYAMHPPLPVGSELDLVFTSTLTRGLRSDMSACF